MVTTKTGQRLVNIRPRPRTKGENVGGHLIDALKKSWQRNPGEGQEAPRISAY
jgi:hypothetical protein